MSWFCGDSANKLDKSGDWCTCGKGKSPLINEVYGIACVEDTWLEEVLGKSWAVFKDPFCQALSGPFTSRCSKLTKDEIMRLESAIEYRRAHGLLEFTPVSTDAAGQLCPWDHGWGGKGFTVCKHGCDEGQKSTDGCNDHSWCAPGLDMFPGKSCMCPAATSPYLCAPGQTDPWCNGTTRLYEQGGCNNNDFIKCSGGDLAVWAKGAATGLECNPKA